MEPGGVLFAVAFMQRPQAFVPGIGLAAGDFPGEVHALQPGPGGGVGFELVQIKKAIGRVVDHAGRRARIADQPGQAARVDTGEADQVV